MEMAKRRSRPNRYTDGLDYDIRRGSVEGFMRTHNRTQRLFMHSILHSKAASRIPYRKRKALHDAIVRKDIKNHKSPL
jgi:hypothetical protein